MDCNPYRPDKPELMLLRWMSVVVAFSVDRLALFMIHIGHLAAGRYAYDILYRLVRGTGSMYESV